MSQVNITELSDLTGLDRRTIQKKIRHLPSTKQGRKVMYASADALACIYEAATDYEEKLDLSQERALLAREQRLLTEIKRRTAEGDSLEAGQVAEVWSGAMREVKQRLMSVGPNVTPELLSLSEPVEIEQKIGDAIIKALEGAAAHARALTEVSEETGS